MRGALDLGRVVVVSRAVREIIHHKMCSRRRLPKFMEEYVSDPDKNQCATVQGRPDDVPRLGAEVLFREVLNLVDEQFPDW